jgi:hypothetical protein
MSGSLTEVSYVELPSQVRETTRNHLRDVGREGLEGMVLWAGRMAGGTSFQVTDTIIPRQEGHRTEHGLAVSVPGDELHRINMWLYRHKLRLIAQVHSHPTHAYHSETDDQFAIATALGCFSLVVPDFAVRPFSLTECAIYRLTKGSWWRLDPGVKWRRVKSHDVATTFQLTE